MYVKAPRSWSETSEINKSVGIGKLELFKGLNILILPLLLPQFGFVISTVGVGII